MLHLLVSRSCYGCGEELIQQEAYICYRCLSQIQQTHFQHQPQENELYYRLAGRVPLAGAYSHFYFDKQGRLQEIIRQLKYKHAPQLGVFLGECMGDYLQESTFFTGQETLMPVPLHPRRKMKRGYNQANQIAKGLALELGLSIDEHTLIRKKRTITQTQTGREQRWENVSQAFLCKKTPPRHVVLVDDVITTGATLEACIRTLYASPNPPESVKIVSVGMARKH